MLNEKVLNSMSDSEKTTHEKLNENYWQASDDCYEAKNDTEWCLVNNCSMDDAAKYKRLALDLLLEYERKLNKRYPV